MTIAETVREALEALNWAVNSETVFGIFSVVSAFIFGGYIVRAIIRYWKRWRRHE